MQKVKAKGQSLRDTEWKQTDGQMDGSDCILPPVLTLWATEGRTAGPPITSHADAVDINSTTIDLNFSLFILSFSSLESIVFLVVYTYYMRHFSETQQNSQLKFRRRAGKISRNFTS